MTSDQFWSNLLRDMRILFPWVWSNFLWVPVPWTINEYTVSIINKLNIKILFLSASYLRKNCLPRRTRRSPGSETYSLTCETKTYFTRCRTQRMAFPVYVSSILLSLNRMIHSWITFDLLDYTPWWPWWPQRRCPTKCLLQRNLPPLWTRSSLTFDHVIIGLYEAKQYLEQNSDVDSKWYRIQYRMEIVHIALFLRDLNMT